MVGQGWRWMEDGREEEGKRKEMKKERGRLYHDITPLLCCYISDLLWVAYIRKHWA